MVKVLKGGVGPDWWIEEPLTEQEQRIKADDEARRARKMIDSNIEPCMPMWRKAIANAPVPPVTRAERAAYNKEYPARNNILCSPEEWKRKRRRSGAT